MGIHPTTEPTTNPTTETPLAKKTTGTPSAQTESQPSTTQGAVYRQYETGTLGFLNEFGGAETSASRGVGEGSFTPSQNSIQDMLLPSYWLNKYQAKVDPKTSANVRAHKDYFVKYSGGSKNKPKSGTARRKSDIDKMIPHLNTQLAERKNEPSLVIYKSIDNKYKSIDNKNKNPDGTWNLSGHLGDEEQAAKYYKDDGKQTMLKITLKPGAHDLLFSPEYMALSPSGTQHRPMAELSNMEGRGKFPLTKSSGEGILPGYIGVKAEEGGTKFSLGIGDNKPSEALLKHFIGTIEEGRAANGKWEPNS